MLLFVKKKKKKKKKKNLLFVLDMPNEKILHSSPVETENARIRLHIFQAKIDLK